MMAPDAVIVWLALVLSFVAAGTALAAVGMRTLFVSIVMIGAAGACLAAACALLGFGLAGIILALVFVAWAPVTLLGATLLTQRAAKASRRSGAVATLAGGALVFTAVAWGVWEARGVAPAPQIATEPLTLWPILIVFVACAVGVGVLGYGERGALSDLWRGPRQ